MAEAQVGDGQAAGLLGVVVEVALGVHIGVVADDLDGVLVGAHGAVGAQAPELTGGGASGSGIGVLGGIQGQMGHVVLDADGEALLGLVPFSMLRYTATICAGRGVLGAQAVAAGVHRGRSQTECR